MEVLQAWLEQEENRGWATYEYMSFREALESLVVSASFSAHGKHVARIALNDSNKLQTAASVTKAVKNIQVRAKKSVKFRFLFRNLLTFLDDIEKSRACNLISFIEILANDMLGKRDIWYLDFIHRQLRAKKSPRNAYETTLATLSLFFREGAGLESFYMKGAWSQPDRAYNASLTLIMYSAVMMCAPNATNEINVTEFSGIERILSSGDKDHKFIRYVSLSSTMSEELFKDKMMWDITLNCCNEFIESTWSHESLERAVWALQYGMKHLDSDVYQKLEELNGKRKLDLTQLNVVSLVSFSISGMVSFSGMDDCIYKITQDENAKISLHGTLPMPTIQDLVKLNIVMEKKGSQYVVKRIPGCVKNVKGLPVGDRIRFISSPKAVPFKARSDQLVG